MARRERDGKHGEAEILLGLLDAVARDGGQSQRGFAAELDIALGLVNAYLARCVKKGWVKARGAPARRYFYYLTPRGFAEKSRLTVQFLTSSFSFFREAKQDCLSLFAKAHKQGFSRIVLVGRSDFADIAAICAADSDIHIVGMVDARGGLFMGLHVSKSFGDLNVEFDAAMVVGATAVEEVVAQAAQHVGAARVLVPDLLCGHMRRQRAA